MMVELVQQVTEWLRDPTTGIAALLPTMPKPGGEVTPVAPTIYDETERDDVAGEFIPAELVAGGAVLLVTGESATSDGPEFVTAASCGVLIRYASRTGGRAGVLHARRVMRAVHRSLLLAIPSEMSPPVVRSSVAITRPERIEEASILRAPDDQLVVAGVRVTFAVIDHWAIGL